MAELPNKTDLTKAGNNKKKKRKSGKKQYKANNICKAN